MTSTPGLVGRLPAADAGRLLADLVPPPRFAGASFEGYHPDPGHPGQAAALARLAGVAAQLGGRPRRRTPFGLGSRRGRARRGTGLYLDGGFGVGKTHLLAALHHAARLPVADKVYGTFVEYTHLVGALGFPSAVAALTGRRLVGIDEFELDDPGDTVLMARLIRELMDSGVTVVATSNTLPEALGEGRFAAEDFLREIQALAAAFEVVRLDGPDYRHRGRPSPPAPATEADLAVLARCPGAAVDDFPALLDHLGRLHPSRYGALLDGVSGVGWRGVAAVGDQAVALRLVVLVDRLYDRGVPVVATGEPVDAVFDRDMLRSGYRKKYLRALSRLAALAADGVSAQGGGRRGR
ncbi:MAG: cell division protein ZapE [Kineosporiaceae bacterium]